MKANRVGEIIKKILRKERISTWRIEKQYDISRSYLSRIINGKINPSYLWVEKLLSKLGYVIKIEKK